jgi:hypothetical protein
VSKLVAGLIAAGTSCPFLTECKFKVHQCPGSDNGVHARDFSCAAARLHDTISKPTTSQSFAATAKSLVVKDRTQPGNPHGEDIIIEDDDGYTD